MKDKTITGIISINSKGTGFISQEGVEDDIEIQNEELNKALHGDEVTVELTGKVNRGRRQGKVTSIVKRVKMKFVGVVEQVGEMLFLVPDDKRLYRDIAIKPADANGAVTGDKVYTEITEWNDAAKSPLGKVLEVIGKHGENNTEMRAIILDRGLAYDFPAQVEREANEIDKNKAISAGERAKRRDFSDTPTFTIDPVDAKDFDDAISVKFLEEGKYEIGVHIADVSHYVREGTALDAEARQRGFSVYLVDRTVPMLPEVLSNDVCSLNPNEEKCTFSAVFVMNDRGDVLERWFGKTIIKSWKRFAYEEAQEVMDKQSGPHLKELNLLNSIAKKLKAQKDAEGALDFEQDEVKFQLDETGRPIKVFRKVRKDAHKLVEEYMLLANREVALHMWKSNEKTRGSFVYRIHDVPVADRIEELALFVRALGYDLPVSKQGVKIKDLKALFMKIAGKPEESLIKTATIRSMAKAIYSTKNIGHYGLAFEYYTHFTSPIRRYADLIVHRLLQRQLTNGQISVGEASFYEKISVETSEKEVKAAEAERASIKYKQVQYMSERIGQVFDGTITGVSEWGIYVEDKETKCEGMVRLITMTDDYYSLNKKSYAIIGEKSGKKYSLGDSVKFKVMNADLEKRMLDYTIIPEGSAK